MSQRQVASSGDMSQKISNASVTPATVSIYYCDRNRVGRQPLGTGRLLTVQIDTDVESNEHLLALVQPDQTVRSRLLAWPESVKRNCILLGFYTANTNKAASSKVAATSKTSETIKESAATSSTPELMKWFETSNITETIKDSGTSKTPETIKELAATSKTSETIKQPAATSKTPETVKQPAATSKTPETIKQPAATSKTPETIKESSNSVAGMLGRIGYGYLLNCCNRDCSLLKFTVVKSSSASMSKNRLKSS
ncbi:hypothetical protein BOX15_Mlig010019g1 [Macrostomum lignano]|uniref:Uncharacterized protein n=1 Tax=Macrostomum lignano TaxID=282301 RepID=A0A267ESU0_9PLAT|nr:hypothetical protein BOX15_Mlig010019g1 [Macrostomum lignano]